MQRLGHEPRVQADMRIAHFAFNFRAGHKCRDRVDHDNVHCAAAHERVGNFQRLFARVGLGDEQVVHMYAQVFRIGGVERVFRVNKRSGAARLLAFGDGVQRDRRFARGLRAVDLDDAAAREPPTPSARSSDSEPEEMCSIGLSESAPRRMIAPLPNCFSICERAVSNAFVLSSM